MRALSARAPLARAHVTCFLSVGEQVRRDAPEVSAPNAMDLLRWPGVLGDRQQHFSKRRSGVVVSRTRSISLPAEALWRPAGKEPG